MTQVDFNSLINLILNIFFSLLIKASGAGEYWGEYEGVRCKVYFKATPYQKDDDRTYLSVDTVKMDFSVKDITMGVENDNNNRVIRKFHDCKEYLADQILVKFLKYFQKIKFFNNKRRI